MTRRQMAFVLQTVRRLCDLEASNRVDIASAMNSIRALVADIDLPEVTNDATT